MKIRRIVAPGVRSIAVLAALLAVGGGLLPGMRPVGDPRLAAATSTPIGPTFTFVQANLESPQPVAGFQADVGTVLAQNPDFVTYNEVAYRSDAVLAPAPYAMFRTPGKYTGENVVAWNADKWHAVATGTTMISNSTAKTKRQRVYLGMRYASWATLQADDGRVVSVVSVHTPPKIYPVADLLAISMIRVGRLVSRLGASGPVIVGGDLNMEYHGARYQRDTLEQYGLTPTFDVMGSAMPTHDGGGVVDYILLHDNSQIAVSGQYALPLNSDHNLLAAQLSIAAPTGLPVGGIQPTTFVSDPSSSPSLVAQQIVRVLNGVPAGSAVHIATRRLGGKKMVHAIARAYARGVEVQLITGETRTTPAERRLAQLLGRDTSGHAWAVNRASVWKRKDLPAASVLASQSVGTPAVRVVVNHPLVVQSQRRTMRAVVRTDKTAYDELFVRFFAAIGRQV